MRAPATRPDDASPAPSLAPDAPGVVPQVRVRECTGRDDLALVYLLQLGEGDDRLVETVDSVDPRFGRDRKSVIILSTQLGCPVGCLMCDAGGPGAFRGNLTADELLAQVRFVVERRPEVLRTQKLKVHFARMGEPALNPQVLEALERLPEVLPLRGLVPCIATVAPAAGGPFLEALLDLRRTVYAEHDFQLQLSINTTDPALRRRLMPVDLMPLDRVAELGARFYTDGRRKPVLNFALARDVPLSAEALRRHFDPERFAVKLTPVNPTERAREHGLDTVVDDAHQDAAAAVVEALQAEGYDVIVSIGEADEVAIGSNCGQLARRAQAGAGG